MSSRPQQTATFTLDADCTIYQAADLHEKLGRLLNTECSISIDVSAIEQMDASCLQLLLAAQQEARQKNCPLTLSGESDTLKNWSRQLYCEAALDGNLNTGHDATAPQEQTHES